MERQNDEAIGASEWDDVTVLEIDPIRVRKARREEMEFFKEMNAYTC